LRKRRDNCGKIELLEKIAEIDLVSAYSIRRSCDRLNIHGSVHCLYYPSAGQIFDEDDALRLRENALDFYRTYWFL